MIGWIEGMPNWFKAGAVIAGLLSLGAAGGKAVNDIIGYKALIVEVQLLRQDVRQQTCIQVAQLRKSDWTLCLVPSNATH
jgi:hypothetical protein